MTSPLLDEARRKTLEAEAAKVARADEAIAEAIDAVHTEAIRLRDSRAVANDLRRHLAENNFTERITLSMQLRGRGHPA